MWTEKKAEISRLFVDDAALEKKEKKCGLGAQQSTLAQSCRLIRRSFGKEVGR